MRATTTTVSSSDIAAWAPKVASGGWLSGDDYDAHQWPGVVGRWLTRYRRASLVDISMALDQAVTLSPNEADGHKHDRPGLAASRGNYPVRRHGDV